MSNSWLALQRGIAGREAAGPNLARELHSGKRARTIGRNQVRSPELSGTEGDAEKVAHSGGTTSLRTTQGLGGTGVWSAEATAQPAAVPHPRTGSGSRGVHAGLQPDANVPSQTAAVSWK